MVGAQRALAVSGPYCEGFGSCCGHTALTSIPGTLLFSLLTVSMLLRPIQVGPRFEATAAGESSGKCQGTRTIGAVDSGRPHRLQLPMRVCQARPEQKVSRWRDLQSSSPSFTDTLREHHFIGWSQHRPVRGRREPTMGTPTTRKGSLLNGAGPRRSDGCVLGYRHSKSSSRDDDWT